MQRLIDGVLTPADAELIRGVISFPELTGTSEGEQYTQAEIAYVLNLALFADLVARVPSLGVYIAAKRDTGQRIILDHGAMRTVRGKNTGSLPSGKSAIVRILQPLGYQCVGEYPLDRLGMIGRSYAHRKYPESIPQFFVSELMPERFSDQFQATVDGILGSSIDPLTPDARALLEHLGNKDSLLLIDATTLIGGLLPCFGRQHGALTLANYEALLSESPEMAWIATEGQAFNHATSRVADVAREADFARGLGLNVKPTIEVSRSERVRQTALRADEAQRAFLVDGATVTRQVPGSFFEFIQRDRLTLPDGTSCLDLSFDSQNAQGIFKMTAAPSKKN
jgi:Domain of unknown function (DUF1338)